MAKLPQNFAKYMIVAKMEAKGVVEKPDVIGAIFGQTEGLLGTDLELRDLQRTGRIGRIEVEVKTEKGKSYATITVPSSLGGPETCLIAAALETIEKVGPCDAKIVVEKVEDVRTQKRKYVVDRAKELLKKLVDNVIPDAERLSEAIKEEVRASEISNYKGLPAGPGIEEADEIIVVEGRADVLNLLKAGIKNVIGMGGSRIPDTIVKLSSEKTVTAFIDGDRGGDLDLKKLLGLADIDFVARAPRGKEVEDLTKKEIFKALRDKVPAEHIREEMGVERPKAQEHEQEDKKETKEKKQGRSEEEKKQLLKMLEEVIGAKAGYLINSKGEVIVKFPLAELNNILMSYSDGDVLVLDMKINQQVVNVASHKNISAIVCRGLAEPVNRKGIELIYPK